MPGATASCVLQVEDHAADLGLVLNAIGADLGDDREAEQRCRRRRIVGRVRDGARDQRQVERVQHASQFLVGQPVLAARLGRAAADLPRLLRIDVIEAPQQTRAAASATPRRPRSWRARGRHSRERRRPGSVSSPLSSGCGRPASAITHARIGFADAPARRALTMPCADRRHGRFRLRGVDRRVDDEQRVGVLVGERDLDGLPILVGSGGRHHVDRIARCSRRRAGTPRAARASRRENGATVSLTDSQASTARMPGPPALVTIATRRPRAAAARRDRRRRRTSRRWCPRE